MKLTLFVLATFLYLGGSALAGEFSFTLINNTGVEIIDLYFSPASHGKWGKEVLLLETLPQGEEVGLQFSRPEKADAWDIKILDEQETAFQWSGLKLSEVSKVVLTIKNGQPVAFAK
ncbi:MAG: hypothetical protein A2107_16085 [Verrucomicrobia bacterium GWF2_62_7]|nr:MAG: hypothetical protein A2107_16085 [Verrucomicrobia bacterium GWF2_62_7]